MNVSLTKELEEFVRQKVAGGMYHSVSEVIRDGLRLLAERDRLRDLRIEELRKEIQVGLDELDRGEGIPAEQVFAEVRQGIAQGKRPPE